MNTNQNEIVIKVLDKLALAGSNLGEKIVADILDEVLHDYSITLKENALITTDMPEKIYYFLACKKLEGLSVKTLKNYMYILKHFSMAVYKPVNSIDIYDLRIYINERSKHIKQTSLEPTIWAIKSFFSWMHEEGYINTNHSKKLKVPKRSKNLREGLNIEQVELVRMNCYTQRERALIEFLLSTGCRVGELEGLKHTDIANGQIKVCGKGDKERIVYINQKATLYLKMYLKSRKGESDYLFISERKPFNYIKIRALEDEVSDIGDRIGINLYPHIFRHTFATLYLENGGLLNELQELLGHEDANTTSIYGKLSLKNIRHAHNKHSVI